ncbi:unnamed protein product [Didymodactylos carnosus]|uniref:Uncharacterized protein n=1 Tax=Didymodactylos carnosus TaxID=1234261 RepID=A0A8S2F7H9_9BILA|nr:unnamed protein product [Didymodactylos carnosus]CAF4167406.1 unnamed protein product [Didymodactylos carnosus]
MREQAQMVKMAFNDLKSQYILAFAILKHDGPENKWNKISDDIREHVLASPVACLKQYNELSRLYQNDWQKSGDNEPFYKYLYFKLKKSYYSELCDKIQESRKVIDVVYEFVRHFGDGRIQVQDINDLIKQVDLKPLVYTKYRVRNNIIPGGTAQTTNDIKTNYIPNESSSKMGLMSIIDILYDDY